MTKNFLPQQGFKSRDWRFFVSMEAPLRCCSQVHPRPGVVAPVSFRIMGKYLTPNLGSKHNESIKDTFL